MVYDRKRLTPIKSDYRKRDFPMITPEMSIAEVMRMDPEVAPVFMSYGMHCLYCPHASLESIAEASLVHGIDAAALVAALNEYFADKEGK